MKATKKIHKGASLATRGTSIMSPFRKKSSKKEKRKKEENMGKKRKKMGKNIYIYIHIRE